VPTTDPTATTIAFIGTRHTFSPCMARTVSSEIDDAGVARFDSLAEFIAAPKAVRAATQIVFIDAKCASGLLELTADDLKGFGTAIRAIAYEDVSEIAPVFARLREESGIKGFLPMHVRLDVWLSIIRLLASGGGYVPDELIEHSTPPMTGPAVPEAGGVDRLTPRENEVLQLVAKGVQNKNIATTLALSEHTVKLHIHHIISKLGVRNRTEATAHYFERIKA
jgi:DNA-binding NarL/FixJ family response regulator